jgi:hypothetical protein
MGVLACDTWLFAQNAPQGWICFSERANLERRMALCAKCVSLEHSRMSISLLWCCNQLLWRISAARQVWLLCADDEFNTVKIQDRALRDMSSFNLLRPLPRMHANVRFSCRHHIKMGQSMHQKGLK